MMITNRNDVHPRGWWLFTFDCFVAYKTAILIFMRCSFKKDPNRTTDKFMVFVFLNLCFEFFHLGRNSFEVWNTSISFFFFLQVKCARERTGFIVKQDNRTIWVGLPPLHPSCTWAIDESKKEKKKRNRRDYQIISLVKYNAWMLPKMKRSIRLVLLPTDLVGKV